MPEFTCQDCGDTFSLSQSVLDRYPGWTPKQCMSCRAARPNRRPSERGAKPVSATTDPTTGVFTDGSSHPNPGPGGWGFVWVTDGEIQLEGHGGETDETTNNRMELTALIEASICEFIVIDIVCLCVLVDA